MSKIATLKSLPKPSELRQTVQELGQMLEQTSARLDQTARQVQSLEQLPSLVADQVTEALKALDPVLGMRQDVSLVLGAYDAVTKAQRSSLESMSEEISDRTVASMETKAAGLAKTMQDLDSQVQGLKSTVGSMEAASKGMQALPSKLASAATEAATAMQSSAGELALQAQKVRPSAWLTLGQLLAAAVLGSLLVAAGQVGLNRLLPPTATERDAENFRVLWAKATPQERALMNQIAAKPAR